jgi:predicted molibdopterin-dependent oxidoreductase YjgC
MDTGGKLTDYSTVPTVCPYCGTGCGMLLEVSGGGLVGVLPQKGHPVSDGTLCIKGWAAHEFVESPKRLVKPLIRRDGKRVPVPMEDALALVAAKLRATVEEYGPDAAAFVCSAKCTNEEDYLVSKMARATVGTNNIDHCARL